MPSPDLAAAPRAPEVDPDDPDEADRLRQVQATARLLAQVSHPHIGAVLGCGHTDGRPYIAFEYIHGETLETVLARAGATGRPLPPGAIAHIGAAAASALHHARGLAGNGGDQRSALHLHWKARAKDLLIGYDGSVKLVGFEALPGPSPAEAILPLADLLWAACEHDAASTSPVGGETVLLEASICTAYGSDAPDGLGFSRRLAVLAGEAGFDQRRLAALMADRFAAEKAPRDARGHGAPAPEVAAPASRLTGAAHAALAKLGHPELATWLVTGAAAILAVALMVLGSPARPTRPLAITFAPDAAPLPTVTYAFPVETRPAPAPAADADVAKKAAPPPRRAVPRVERKPVPAAATPTPASSPPTPDLPEPEIVL
jgi:hypothetical protein